MKFFDANIFAGLPAIPARGAVVSAGELLEIMDGAGISKALLWHAAQHDNDAAEGNKKVSRLTAGSTRLYGCWALLPPQTGEVVRQGIFEEMKAANAVALRAFPGAHRYLLNRDVFGKFLDAVSDRRIPLLLSLCRGVKWEGIYALLAEYPGLTCVICDLEVWGCDRFCWPLLEKYPRVFVETSLLSVEAGGLEAGVRRYGAERYLFGSGFPLRYPEAAMMDLIHSGLTEEEMDAVAGGNLEALIKEAVL